MANEMMHVGMVVPDLDQAIAEYSGNYGLTFTAPRTSQTKTFREGNTERSIEVRYVFSHEGPPYYELIEAHDSGFFGPANGTGFHHIGVWESDCDQKLAEMVGRGMINEAAFIKPEGGIRVAYLKPPGDHGLRVEIMDASSRAATEEWIRQN